ncbi:hypothetical protein H5T88_04725 [bacterium]|nr:hypothetical protein [bacterium]
MQRRYFLFLNFVFFSLRCFAGGNIALDSRFITNEKSNILLYGEEINYKYELPAGTIYLQALNQSPKGERNDLRIGEAWFTINFADNKLIAKVGRFPLPFALNAVYDPHFQVIQPLYQQSIGLRLDEGACLQGSYGPYKFILSASHGTGGSKSERTTYILRVERKIPDNPFFKGNFGFSLLSGRLPLVDEQGITSQLIDKSRVGLDFQALVGSFHLLGEAHIGGDKDINVGGFFLLAKTPIKNKIECLFSWRSFNFDMDKEREVRLGGAGISWEIDKHNRLSFVYQRDFYNKKNFYTLQLLTSYSFDELAKLQRKFRKE